MKKSGPIRDILTVVMVDTHRNRIALIHENSTMPYRMRTVHIKLTEEQLELLRPQWVGTNQGEDIFEELGEVWLELEDEMLGVRIDED